MAGQQRQVGRGGIGTGWQQGSPQGGALPLEGRPVAGIETPGLRRLRHGRTRGVTALPRRATLLISPTRHLPGRSYRSTCKGQWAWCRVMVDRFGAMLLAYPLLSNALSQQAILPVPTIKTSRY